MVKGPKISVVIPVYNVADYLSRCLESLRRQTLLDIEIICVNDGSTDNSDEIIREQMKIDSRIQLIDKQNAGVAAARNTGIDAATGDMIVFLDPDDYLTTNACERIYEERINHYADIIVYGSKPFPEIPEPDAWVAWKLNSRDIYYPEPNEKSLFGETNSEPFIWNHAYSRDLLNRLNLERILYFCFKQFLWQNEYSIFQINCTIINAIEAGRLCNNIMMKRKNV